MRTFDIKTPDPTLEEKISDLIYRKTRPYGNLGKLEETALQLALIQNSQKVSIEQPHLLLFASDHGIADENVSRFPQEFSYQLVLNVMSGKSPINLFADQHKMKVTVVDSGIRYDFNSNLPIVHAKIRKGTRNFLKEAAMTEKEMNLAIEKGAEIVSNITHLGCNTIGFGEMGVANTSSAAIITALLLDKPIEECADLGSGLDQEGIDHKVKILKSAINQHGKLSDPLKVLMTFGGYETAMTVGGIMQAAQEGMIIFVDGFISSAALLVAAQIDPRVMHYCFFSHRSKEKGHKHILEHYGKKALVNLSLQLGEGTGAALALPLFKSSAEFLNNCNRLADMHFNSKQ